jgi:hypothetical protein
MKPGNIPLKNTQEFLIKVTTEYGEFHETSNDLKMMALGQIGVKVFNMN